MNRIVNVLVEHGVDWETLAEELAVESRNIRTGCLAHGGDLIRCCLRILVKTYNERTGLEALETIGNIAQALTRIGNKAMANTLRKEFNIGKF